MQPHYLILGVWRKKSLFLVYEILKHKLISLLITTAPDKWRKFTLETEVKGTKRREIRR